VGGAEFFGAIVVGITSFLALWWSLRVREEYVRDKRVEEWHRWLAEEKRKKQRNDR
tara:strand:- start:556 stop:723 length:168 start_codon:yes stop_codon:yes gene_type:complete